MIQKIVISYEEERLPGPGMIIRSNFNFIKNMRMLEGRTYSSIIYIIKIN